MLKYANKWDELNLKIDEVQVFSNLIDNGVNEVELLNTIINIHNRGFEKGKNAVINEFNCSLKKLYI